MLQAVKEHPDSYKGHFQRYHIEYKGKIYDSKWEVLVRKYFDNNYLTVTSDVKARIPYWYKNAYHTYIPDFYLLKLKIYVEVKGIVTKRDIAKWKQFPDNKRLLVLTRNSVFKIKKHKKLGLVRCIRNTKSKILVDGEPISDLSSFNITYLKKVTKKAKLTKDQISEAIKEGIRKSPYSKELRRKARLKEIRRRKTLNKSYTGKRNSQYGTFWITNGNVNRKWTKLKGSLPKDFVRGRVM